MNTRQRDTELFNHVHRALDGASDLYVNTTRCMKIKKGDL